MKGQCRLHRGSKKNGRKPRQINLSMGLYEKVKSLAQTPLAGMAATRKPGYRRLIITKHNKVYYRIKGKTIYIVDLVESSQDPNKNKYE